MIKRFYFLLVLPLLVGCSASNSETLPSDSYGSDSFSSASPDTSSHSESTPSSTNSGIDLPSEYIKDDAPYLLRENELAAYTIDPEHMGEGEVTFPQLMDEIEIEEELSSIRFLRPTEETISISKQTDLYPMGGISYQGLEENGSYINPVVRLNLFHDGTSFGRESVEVTVALLPCPISENYYVSDCVAYHFEGSSYVLQTFNLFAGIEDEMRLVASFYYSPYCGLGEEDFAAIPHIAAKAVFGIEAEELANPIGAMPVPMCGYQRIALENEEVSYRNFIGASPAELRLFMDEIGGESALPVPFLTDGTGSSFINLRYHYPLDENDPATPYVHHADSYPDSSPSTLGDTLDWFHVFLTWEFEPIDFEGFEDGELAFHIGELKEGSHHIGTLYAKKRRYVNVYWTDGSSEREIGTVYFELWAQEPEDLGYGYVTSYIRDHLQLL